MKYKGYNRLLYEAMDCFRKNIRENCFIRKAKKVEQKVEKVVFSGSKVNVKTH